MNRKLTRRVFLRRTGAGGAAAAAIGCLADSRLARAAPANEEPSVVKSKPDVIVHRGGYPGWPWVTRAGEHRLVCVFRDDGVHGFSPTGKVMWTSSDDDGKTWAAAQVVVDEPGVDDRNAAVARLPDGTLMVCYNTYTKDHVSQTMVTRSSNGGATWARPRPIADLDARTRGAPILLSSGDLLIPIYRAPGNGSIAARSADGGKSWALSHLSDTEGFVGDEWVVLEVEKGRIVGIIRNNGVRDGHFWKTESRDGARTWDVPVKTNVRDARSTSPAHLDLHGTAAVLTYADRRMVSVSMVTTADPGFRRWDVEGRLLCYQYRPDGKPIADASYPVSVAVGKHRRFIVDYEIRPEGKWIAGYFVDLPEDWQ
jgi:Neuraminidase (sialidase)